MPPVYVPAASRIRSPAPSSASAEPPVLTGASEANGASERPSPPTGAAASTNQVIGPPTWTVTVPVASRGWAGSLSCSVYSKLSSPVKPTGGTYANVPSGRIATRAPLGVGDAAVAVSSERGPSASWSLSSTDASTASSVLPTAPSYESTAAAGARFACVTA